MDWKDTAMPHKQRVECSHNPNLELREKDICLAQAEITWKLAFKAGMEYGNTKAYEIGVEDGRVIGVGEGINIVVEWIHKNGTVTRGRKVLKTPYLDWQSFKESKGMEGCNL